MNRVDHYLPGAFDRGLRSRELWTADSPAELIAIPWIFGWSQNERFHRFSITLDATLRASWDRDLALRALMCEWGGGATWYVIAGLENPEVYGLPTWRAP